MFGPDGKQKTEYLVGFVNPTGWGYAPPGFGGGYAGNLFIVDSGQPAARMERTAMARFIGSTIRV